MLLSLTLVAALATPPSQADLDACAVAQITNDFAAWASYLETFGGGVCGRAPAASDVRDCLQARGDSNPESWSRYASMHPRGFCITEAKAVIHDDQVERQDSTEPTPSIPGAVGGAEATLGTVVVGALTRDEVRASLAGLAEPLQGCGAGVAQVRAVISADGTLKTVRVDGVEAPVASCIESAMLASLRFPIRDAPTTVVHRFVLDAAE